MKNILITAENSYIGNSVQNWLLREPDKYNIDTVSLRKDSWSEKNFDQYDVVFHVAGIAHVKEKKKNQSLYYKVNRDLTYDVAKKAKKDGVKQFIFLSSMSVYGVRNGIIDKDTPLKPRCAYGKSKIEAEQLIEGLADNTFIVAILRPPMVYGENCKGNYTKLANIALKMPFFPNINNERSMIYIDNLAELVKKLIDNCDGGLLFPQNAQYVKTSEMVRIISEVHGKKIIMTKLFNPFIKLMNISFINKVFGSLMYEKSMSRYKEDYTIFSIEESIYKTERSIHDRIEG